MRWLAQQLGTLQMRQMDRQSCLMHEGMHKGMSNDVVGVIKGKVFQRHSVFEFNTDESQCLRWLGSQPATSRRDVGMARPPQQPNGGIA
jgi:hypothetical protein